MDIFITDLAKISKKSIFIKKAAELLLPRDRKRFLAMTCANRKLQFLVGRLMIYRFLGKEFSIEKSGKLVADNAFLSLSHSKNLVVLALSETPVGVDVEYILKKRKYQEIAQFLHLGKCTDQKTFYKLFTQYEADYKLGHTTKKIDHTFFLWKNYLICSATFSKTSWNVYEYFPVIS